MRILPILLLSLLFTGCISNKCIGTARPNGNDYLLHLEDVKRERSRLGVRLDDFEKAISYLSIVTGIQSKSELGDYVYYKSKADYWEDLRSWRRWYKKNKCKLTEHYIDSVYKSVNIKRPQ